MAHLLRLQLDGMSLDVRRVRSVGARPSRASVLDLENTRSRKRDFQVQMQALIYHVLRPIQSAQHSDSGTPRRAR
jgi:hypothetical protein